MHSTVLISVTTTISAMKRFSESNISSVYLNVMRVSHKISVCIHILGSIFTTVCDSVQGRKELGYILSRVLSGKGGVGRVHHAQVVSVQVLSGGGG